MKINEIVMISGKGGTGKTTLTASLLPFLEKTVLADCDVDAPDLDILLKPEIKKSESFCGMDKAVRLEGECSRCGLCVTSCRFQAVTEEFTVIPGNCEGCGVCVHVCPESLFSMEKSAIGKIFTSETSFGPMVHARLNPGEDNAGKLVSEVRRRARSAAEEMRLMTVLIDGSPGTGCSVISSITGAGLVIAVTEPTVSGLHDLKRVYDIVRKFSGRAVTVINKCDLSHEICREIERVSDENAIPVVLKIPFAPEIIQCLTRKEIPSIALPEIFRAAGWEEFTRELSF